MTNDFSLTKQLWQIKIHMHTHTAKWQSMDWGCKGKSSNPQIHGSRVFESSNLSSWLKFVWTTSYAPRTALQSNSSMTTDAQWVRVRDVETDCKSEINSMILHRMHTDANKQMQTRTRTRTQLLHAYFINIWKVVAQYDSDRKFPP